MEKDNQSKTIDMPSKITDNLTKIADNLYCAEIPLPNNPLRHLNVYIIKGNVGAAAGSTSNGISNSGRGHLIDTG